MEEKLLDVFISEADPAGWPGRGLQLAAMDAQTRGDLYWCRKTAASALVLASKVQTIIGRTQASGLGTTPDGVEEAESTAQQEQQIDDDYARAEREAARLMRELQTGTGKAEFSRRTHGKA